MEARSSVIVSVRGRGSFKPFRAKRDSFDKTLHHISEVGWTSASAEGKWFHSFHTMQAYKEKYANRLSFEVYEDDDDDGDSDVIDRVVGAVFK